MTQRWYVRRVRINLDGYDRSGNYWGGSGGGTPLWHCYSADGALECHVRGHRDWARTCYENVRAHNDPAYAAQYVSASGFPPQRVHAFAGGIRERSK